MVSLVTARSGRGSIPGIVNLTLPFMLTDVSLGVFQRLPFSIESRVTIGQLYCCFGTALKVQTLEPLLLET